MYHGRLRGGSRFDRQPIGASRPLTGKRRQLGYHTLRAEPMLVSHLCRFIYLKTIKTGGTSVEIYFEPWCVPPAQWRGEQHSRAESVSEWGIVGARGSADGFVRPDCAWYNHMPAAAVREKVGSSIWNSYFK